MPIWRPGGRGPGPSEQRAIDQLLAEKDKEIARLAGRVEQLVRLVDDLSRPALRRRGDGPAGTSVISGRTPRTRASLVGTALLIMFAVGAVLIIAPWAAEVPRKKSEASTGAVCSPLRDLGQALVRRYSLTITSTTGGSHAPGSYHYRGMAIDIGGGYGAMNAAASYLITSGRYRGLIEGIHNPNLSVSNGRRVSPSFWGPATWGQHANHLHLAGCSSKLSTNVRRVDYHDRLPLAVRRRSHGHRVCITQRKLNRLAARGRPGHRPHRVRVDCRYGRSTALRVRGFQGRHHLHRDGVTGRRTWRAIRRA
jgi:peptidoglycan hydrolase-like protein with peptidoglycan-binding domain